MSNIQSLQDILILTPHVRLATKADNHKILNFYHQTEMSATDSSIKYTRGNDFFSFLNERSNRNLVFTLWNDQDELEGMAVITYFHGFINQEPLIIGYLGDLRVNLNRKLIREWRKFYSLLIEHSPQMVETYHCRYYQTVIIDDNSKAKNNLIETKIENLKYQRLQNYTMYNFVGKINLPIKKHYQMTKASAVNDETILNFLNKCEMKRAFGKDWNYEFEHRLKNWTNFSKDNFIIVKNGKNEIVAIASIWNPIKTKQVISSKIPWLFKIFVPLLNIIPFFELKPLPKENEPIDILYLNQIAYSLDTKLEEQKKILIELINYIFQYKFSILAYADFKSKSLLKDSKLFIGHSIPMAMYTVHHVNNSQELRDQILIDEKSEPGFEMSLV